MSEPAVKKIDPCAEALLAIKDKRFDVFFDDVLKGLAALAEQLAPYGHSVKTYSLSDPQASGRWGIDKGPSFYSAGKIDFESDHIGAVEFIVSRGFDLAKSSCFFSLKASDKLFQYKQTFLIGTPSDPNTWCKDGQKIADFLFETLPFYAVRPSVYTGFKATQMGVGAAAKQPKAE